MNKPTPPAWIQQLLAKWLDPEKREYLLCDLEEQYEVLVEKLGKKRADRSYCWIALGMLRPVLLNIRLNNITHTTSIPMWHHFFKITLRNLARHRLYTGVNILGLSVSITACLLITLYIHHEYSYDQHQPHADHIYRVLWQGGSAQNSGKWVGVAAAPMAATLVETYPEVLQAGRMNYYLGDAGRNLMRIEGEKINTFEDGFVYADQAILALFEFSFISGETQSALERPYSMVITQQMAAKYFGDSDPIGKTIVLNQHEDRPYTITGVVEASKPSHVKFNFLLSLKGLENSHSTDWMATNYHTYLLVAPGTDPQQLEEKLSQLVATYVAKQEPKYDATSDKDDAGWYYQYGLQPLTAIHLGSAEIGDPLTHGSMQTVQLFLAIAIAIIIVAIINFINLSTARSVDRQMEVGICKMLGSHSRQLIGRFLVESLVVSMIAVVLGILLTYFILPGFNQFLGKTLVLPWNRWRWVLSLFSAILLLGLLAGTYPAVYFSAFSPISFLKGTLNHAKTKLRSTLVVIQFTTTCILIISALVIQQQMSFIQNKDLGFEEDHLLLITETFTLDDQAHAFQHEIQQLADVQTATLSGFLPVEGTLRNDRDYWLRGNSRETEHIVGQQWVVDEYYLSTIGLSLQKGRNFDSQRSTDKKSTIINASMQQALGLRAPIGKQICTTQDTLTIIGVVDDFHYESMRGRIRPLALRLGDDITIMAVKASGKRIETAIQEIRDIWKTFVPNQTFNYTFADEKLAQSYQQERRTQYILNAFTGIAILIGSIGLFALATFSVERRTKEISIRKVMGATVGQLVKLLVHNYLTLIGVAWLLAIPLSYLIVSNWLDDFAYKIPLSGHIFILAGIAIAMIAILSTSYQAYQLIMVNPAKNLRKE